MAGKRRFLLFVYGTPNIVGSALALAGLILFFFGVIKSYWPFIVAGLYAIGYMGVPRNPNLHLSMNHALDGRALSEALDGLLKSVKKHVSDAVLERLSSVSETIKQILPHLEKIESNSQYLHSVKKTVTDYLPSMLETYLQLPPAFARLHRMKSGTTPREMLIEQLDLLQREMDKILQNILENDTDALIAHGKFIKEKFAGDYDWIS
ncbi:hypothetical protein [Thiosocius teredinicola]|uniref:hypothetical protein n=1 Tax=Thiosocius teredinicola TaxID=1973002 RepID=UPI000990B969